MATVLEVEKTIPAGSNLPSAAEAVAMGGEAISLAQLDQARRGIEAAYREPGAPAAAAEPPLKASRPQFELTSLQHKFYEAFGRERAEEEAAVVEQYVAEAKQNPRAFLANHAPELIMALRDSLVAEGVVPAETTTQHEGMDYQEWQALEAKRLRRLALLRAFEAISAEPKPEQLAIYRKDTQTPLPA